MISEDVRIQLIRAVFCSDNEPIPNRFVNFHPHMSMTDEKANEIVSRINEAKKENPNLSMNEKMTILDKCWPPAGLVFQVIQSDK